MKICDIRHVKHKNSFRWKWRHIRADGTVKESAESYQLYYEAVMAARASGYQPQLKCA
ncbi:MAG TPA: hypothetical protein VGX52_11930 [Burkholderiales bacterium]|nr:hypothetical protein [Burkholderiales bacterium]